MDLRVPPVSAVIGSALAKWGRPSVVVCDTFRLADLKDAAPALRIEPRRTRWSEASEDIRALRKSALDGALAVEVESRGLLTVSMAAAAVKPDDNGNVRLVKRGTHNEARDDVAQGLVHAAGELARSGHQAFAVDSGMSDVTFSPGARRRSKEHCTLAAAGRVCTELNAGVNANECALPAKDVHHIRKPLHLGGASVRAE